MNKKLLHVICLVMACAMLITSMPNAMAADIPFDLTEPNGLNLPQASDELSMFTTTSEYVAIREQPSNTGKIVNHAHAGKYVKGTIVTNSKGHDWIKFCDSDGNTRYMYGGNAKKHTSHCWKKAIETDAGWVAICDCGYACSHFSGKDNLDIVVDGQDYLKEVILGDFNETHTFTVPEYCGGDKRAYQRSLP